MQKTNENDTKGSSPFGKRFKYTAVIHNITEGLEKAKNEFRRGDVRGSYDLYEQLLNTWPDHALLILTELHECIQDTPNKDRYNQYQSRFFNFGIQHGQKVLDIGSGNVPFPLATHLADLTLDDDSHGRAGCPFKYVDGKEVYLCNIENMPFADNEFDFIYCSHVLEHVENPEKACKEIMRVGRRGYIETPTRGKDLFLNTAGMSNHKWGIEVFNKRLIFSEYSPEEIRGINCSVVMDMHSTPQTNREKAFSALLTLKADVFNAMLLWDGEFEFEVRHLPKTGPSHPRIQPGFLEEGSPRFSLPTDIKSYSLKFMLVHTFYEPYLEEFFLARPYLREASYTAMLDELVEDGFGAIHTYTPYMKEYGYQTFFTVSNCKQSQAQWLQENHLQAPAGNWQQEIVRLQVDHFKPDVLYLGNPLEYDAAFVSTLSHRPKLIMGWRASPIPQNADMSHLDVVLSHLSVCRNQALALGARAAEYFAPGVPTFIPESVRNVPQKYDVVFSGQWTPAHRQRNDYIQRIAEAAATGAFSLGLFISVSDQNMLPQVVARFNNGPCWGMDMYRVLKSGRIVVNAEIDIARGEAGNMRLFETTATGSFLLTEYHPNIEQYFSPGKEIETFHKSEELLNKIDYYLSHTEERKAIALRGQQRCFRTHGMEKRIIDLDAIIRKYLHFDSINTMKNITPSFPPFLSTDDRYDIAYRYGWENPNLKELVYLCYKTPDFASNARRFFSSTEFQETINILTALGKPPNKNSKVIDFGCGNGIASYSLSRAGYSVVGVDSSNGDLAGIRAASKLQNLDDASFELIHTTINSLDWPDGTFDIFFMREALHHIKDLKSFLAEAMRVLKPSGLLCCLRDVVIWNESQRENFFATHPFYPITDDEGCYYLKEYLEAFAASGFTIEKILQPNDSIINTYPYPLIPGLVFDETTARARQTGYDLYSFFLRRPDVLAMPFPQPSKANTPLGIQEFPDFASLYPEVNFGHNIQIIGMRNISMGQGSCIGDNTWLNICIRDDSIRMKIGKCVLIGRQSVISTAGYLEIGDFCTLAPRVYVSDADHLFSDINQPILQQGVTENRSVIIEENCWIGINAVISGNLTISRGSIIGANTVVNKNVPPFSVVVGNPGKVIKLYNFETSEWERTTTPKTLKHALDSRSKNSPPSREEYVKLLQQKSSLAQVPPVVAGRNINI